ncbi:protein maelstrom [Drosophila nasuta]|uniref:protein maelstrom n=1 Tax=Drosophila nasuta TaxID=42062 RepID=UPI00295E4460|nr:protein maelstrom [Drosophila nasuta]
MPPKKNGFMAFVQDWRNTAEGRGLTLPQAVARCGGIWSNMNAQQRGPYNSRAKDAEIAERGARERMTSTGQLVSTVESQQREAVQQSTQMKCNIERIVMKGKAQYDLENSKFVFAAFNYFDKTKKDGIYTPAEFAACLFSIKSGKISVYSSLINPGQIMFGQSNDAKLHADSTHYLPLPPKALGETDMGKLYINIVQYLRGCQVSDNPNDPLIVFTSTELMPVVKGCFRYLASDSDIEDTEILVYDIQYLFYILKKEVMEIADLKSTGINKSVTDAVFINDHYEYNSGISCQYHEDNDRCRYCAHSMVSRWAFIFSDYMCGDLAIKPIPGKHLPPKEERKFQVISDQREADITSSSFVSCESPQKLEDKNKYSPTDSTAFAACINKEDDFPTLGGSKPKPNQRPPLSNNFRATSQKSDWNIPTTRRSAKD